MKKPQQIEFEIKRHGGKRRGAGRPKSLRCEPSHAKRVRVNEKVPLLLTIKLSERVPNLRTPRFMRRFARFVRLAQRQGLNFNQFAIEDDHVHFIAEAASNLALERGMQSLAASLMWALRANFGYHGKVLRGRFHTLICKTPTEVRNALRYVLFNHAKHRGTKPYVDGYSSAASFPEIGSLVAGVRRIEMKWEIFLPKPRSWLQSVGWRRVPRWEREFPIASRSKIRS